MVKAKTIKKKKEESVYSELTLDNCSAGDITNRLFEIMQEAHKEYYDYNETLKKYAGRVISGEELIAAETCALGMTWVYSEKMDPIFKFISLHHPYANKVAYDHYEFQQNNKQANSPTQSLILDPNLQ